MCTSAFLRHKSLGYKCVVYITISPVYNKVYILKTGENCDFCLCCWLLRTWFFRLVCRFRLSDVLLNKSTHHTVSCRWVRSKNRLQSCTWASRVRWVFSTYSVKQGLHTENMTRDYLMLLVAMVSSMWQLHSAKISQSTVKSWKAFQPRRPGEVEYESFHQTELSLIWGFN